MCPLCPILGNWTIYWSAGGWMDGWICQNSWWQKGGNSDSVHHKLWFTMQNVNVEFKENSCGFYIIEGKRCRVCIDALNVDALNDDAFAERLRSPLGPICLLSSFSDAGSLNSKSFGKCLRAKSPLQLSRSNWGIRNARCSLRRAAASGELFREGWSTLSCIFSLLAFVFVFARRWTVGDIRN